MAIKCVKKVQISYNLDQVCISSGFINCQKIFEKHWKLADFWTKNRFFALEFQYFFFDGNRYFSFKNSPIDLFFWIHIPIYLYYNIMKSFFEKLFLFVNYYTFYATKEHFFTTFHHFSLNISVIDITTRNTYLVQIIAYLDLFYAFYGHFILNLGPFLIYNLI